MGITIYFVRHAESDKNVKDDFSRPLTSKGKKDSLQVTESLNDKKIDVIISSPYKRAVDTIGGFAENKEIEIETIDNLREWEMGKHWIDSREEFEDFSKQHWTDFSYKKDGSESLAELQERNIAALENILKNHSGKNIVIGTHGMALSTIINFFDKTFGHDNFMSIVEVMPWIVRMDFKFDGSFVRWKVI